MRNAAAKRQEIDAPFINNLTTPFSDVIVNPENPDSKTMAGESIISTDGLVSDVFLRGQV
jgi:hypothetical protein